MSTTVRTGMGFKQMSGTAMNFSIAISSFSVIV